MGIISGIRKPFRYSFVNATLVLVVVNALVFGAQILFGNRFEAVFALIPDDVRRGHVWQIFTYMFLHATDNPMHIIFNMIGLYLFGSRIERRVGSKEFLLFYLLCGTLAGLFSFIFYAVAGVWNVALIGASGAIYALLLAFAAFFPGEIVYIWGIVPVKAPVMVLIFAVIEIGSQLFSSRSGVAHLTHLSGFAVAWGYFLARYGINPWKRFFLR